MVQTQSSTVVIIGGGIIGLSVAYYLSVKSSTTSRSFQIILIEKDEIAGGASGKAGGLLAEWAYPACIVPLSWSLHAELAAKHDGGKEWGYRMLEESINVELQCNPISSTEQHGAGPSPNLLSELQWIDKHHIARTEAISTGKSTAQVHPKLLCNFLHREAVRNGVAFVRGDVQSLDIANGSIQGVKYCKTNSDLVYLTPSIPVRSPQGELETIQCNYAILAAGAWSPLLHPVPITPIRAHSVVLPITLPARALFSSMPYTHKDLFATWSPTKVNRQKKRAVLSQIVRPEIYPRPDGTTYVCGEPDRVALPWSTNVVKPDPTRIALLLGQLKGMSSAFDITPLHEQVCFLPLVEHEQEHLSGPIIGNSSSIQGLIVATGHTAWGIMNSQATGLLVSELVIDGKVTSADINELGLEAFGL